MKFVALVEPNPPAEPNPVPISPDDEFALLKKLVGFATLLPNNNDPLFGFEPPKTEVVDAFWPNENPEFCGLLKFPLNKLLLPDVLELKGVDPNVFPAEVDAMPNPVVVGFWLNKEVVLAAEVLDPKVKFDVVCTPNPINLFCCPNNPIP